MKEKKQPLTKRAFDKVTSVMAGPDAVRFLAFLPIIKAIDDRIDKISADQWPEGKAELGDNTSEFLRKLMTPEDREKINGYIVDYKLNRDDVWQVCNMLAMQLAEIRTLTIATRDQEKSRPKELNARKALVKSHEHLSMLAFAAGAINPAELAPVLRACGNRHGQDNLHKVQEIVEKKSVTLQRKNLSVKEVGMMMQAVDDANDFIVDLISEVEHGRISPNRHVLGLKETGTDPQEYLHNFLGKGTASTKISEGKQIHYDDLGLMGSKIREDLSQHAKMIKEFKGGMALRGIDHTGTYFSTTGDDHDPNATTPNMFGDMGWVGRAKNLIKGAPQGGRA